jgi:hypothetical protein
MRSNAPVCGGLTLVIAGSNSTEDTDVLLLLCVVYLCDRLITSSEES